MKNAKMLLVLLLLVFALPLQSCVVTRPAKPGPNFVWIERHVALSGAVVPGHWKYVGPHQQYRVWVPGHYKRNGRWVPGHWKYR